MALTKVRLPVADIAAISNGTSDVDIASSGADVIVTAAGVASATFGDTANELHVPTTVVNLDGVEDIDMTVSGGATGVLEALAGSIRLWTTSAHSLILGANSTTGLTIETDGQVALAVEGTAANHLVTKDYVDGIAGIAAADIDATLASEGHITIPTNAGDLIINWGETGSLANDGSETVTFEEPFPNSFFAGVVNSHHGLGGDGGFNINSPTTTGMTIYNVSDVTASAYWIAIGY